MPVSLATTTTPRPPASTPGGWRLRKHADYQRVYKAARKQFSPSMTWFYALQPEAGVKVHPGPRVGLTAGRVLGNAVERNRIKRRMREAIRHNLPLLPLHADLVLHPRRIVLEIEFAQLRTEIERIFRKVAATCTGPAKP
jgi:ribonuclease P protein component